MSIEYLNIAFQARLFGATKAVLIALADRCNQAGYCYPALDDIAFRSGCSKRSAMRAVSELEMMGLLVVVRSIGRPNKYLLIIEKLSTTDDAMSPDFSEFSTTSDKVAPAEVIHTSDTVSKTSDIFAKSGDIMSPKPYNHNNHYAHARENGVIHTQQPAGTGRRPSSASGNPTASGSAASPPAPRQRSKSVAIGELMHIRQFLSLSQAAVGSNQAGTKRRGLVGENLRRTVINKIQ